MKLWLGWPTLQRRKRFTPWNTPHPGLDGNGEHEESPFLHCLTVCEAPLLNELANAFRIFQVNLCVGLWRGLMVGDGPLLKIRTRRPWGQY